MNISIAQFNPHIGNFEGNYAKMLDAISQARDQKADIICFGELCVCGYPPRDFLEFDDFIKECEAKVAQLAALTADGKLAIVVGAPTRNPVPEGKDLYNSAYFLSDGSITAVQHKTLLPTYDIFDEYRYFEPASAWNVVEYRGKRIAMTVCEDIWNVGNDNPLYKVCPQDEMMTQMPAGESIDVMLNLSASPFSYDHAADRIATLGANVARYGLPIFYVNHSGASTEVIFDGGSIVMSPDGMVHDELPYFAEAVRTYDLATVVKGGLQREQPKEKTALIHDALVSGIRNYFGKLGFKSAILGLSGGIDSAVVAVLAQRALGAENVRVLLLPSEFSSDHSINDARELAETLGIQYDIVPIKSGFDALFDTLQPHFEGLPFNVAEENMQARTRMLYLMAFSNKFGNVLLNTSNKSEAAVGYGTLYGDMAGGLAILGDLYKTEVYELAHYMNKDGIVIPLNSITKPPSAELRPGQKDSDSLPDYDILDKVLFQYIEKRQGPKELIAMGFDEALVKRILWLVNRNEFKRFQSPPILRVSNKAFGVGRRMPIEGKYLG
jgi:NAD+ synthase (glutamine-hydrolysing)